MFSREINSHVYVISIDICFVLLGMVFFAVLSLVVGLTILLSGLFMVKAARYAYRVYQHRAESISKFREVMNPKNTSLPLFSANKRVSAMVMLGSGGHTAELLTALEEIPRSIFNSLTYVIADTDRSSLIRATKVEEKFNSNEILHFVTLPRAREVGQSFMTSVFTTLYALMFAFKVVYFSRPDVLLVNGPGSCVPLCWAAVFFNILGISQTKIIFIESFTRIKHLSLSGKLLYPLVDRFIVQWPQLQEQHALAEYIGILC